MPPAAPALPPDPQPWQQPPRLADLAVTLALVVGAAGAVALAGPALPEAARPLIFLIAVLIAAVRFGFWTGMIAAALAFFSLNFLFVEPTHTFRIARLQDVVALAVFLLVAGLAGALAGRLHDQAQAAQDRALVLRALSDASADLARPGTAAEVTARLLPHLAALTGAPTFAVGSGAPALIAAHPPGAEPGPATLQAADRALRRMRADPGVIGDGPPIVIQPVADLAAGRLVLAHGLPPQPGRARAIRLAAAEDLARQLALALQRLEAEARAQAESLRAEAEATRSALLASLSHDLRTPLATILGGVSALKMLKADLSPEAEADLLTAVEEEAQRLSRHVENLLQMTRLESGIAPLRTWVDPADVARAALNRIARAYPLARIEADLPSDLALVRSDPGLLEQALFNLAENAIRHGGGAVSVTARIEGSTLDLTVSDPGPGLPPALADWLAGAGTRPAPGQRGLGLAVCKGIARALGLGLSAGPGARITLSLPLEAPA